MAIKEQKITSEYAIYNADCIEVMTGLPEGTVDLSVYSPPFAGLYHYSSDDRDLSNSSSKEEFFKHYAYVVKEIFRLTKPGRLTAVHCADIPSGNCGKDSIFDLPGEIIRMHEELGFYYVARHTIWKEPLWVRNRTMAKALAHKTIVEDAAYAGVASADYMLMFRKKGENKIPIRHPTGFSRYAGEQEVPQELEKCKGWTGNQIENRYSHWIWRRYASSIWDDIDMGRVLPFQHSKDPDDEKHVHPLQLDVIDRTIMLRSNSGEVILTPFMGVGSEVYVALQLDRKAIGIELKPSYYKQAINNLANINKLEQANQLTLDLGEEEEVLLD